MFNLPGPDISAAELAAGRKNEISHRGQALRVMITKIEAWLRERPELERALDGLCELPLGGTAVGTGLNTHPEFAQRVIAGLAEITGLPLREAKDHFAAQAGKEQVVAASCALKTTGGLALSTRRQQTGSVAMLGAVIADAIASASSLVRLLPARSTARARN